MQQTLETLPANLAHVRQIRDEAGRTGDFQVTLGAHVASVDDARRWEDAGATRLLVSPFTNPHEAAEGFRRFGEEIISKL